MASRIETAADNVDIINMSFGTLRPATMMDMERCDDCPNPQKWVDWGMWVPDDHPSIKAACSTAIAEGVVCITSSGNKSKNFGNVPEECDPMIIPFNSFPAEYPGVIAVGGTLKDGPEEKSVNYWNFGDFIDVSGPGVGIWTTDWGGGYDIVDGTSFSSPLVSALVGLLKSINYNLTISQITDILINSTDKITPTDCPDMEYYDENGWNKCLGYGRINAYKALKYTIEHYETENVVSGTISSSTCWSDYIYVTGNVTVNSGISLTIDPGTVVFFEDDKKLIVNGTLNTQGTEDDPIKFTSINQNPSKADWYGIQLFSSNSTLEYCEIEYASRGVYIYNSIPKIEQCHLHDNTYGCYVNYLSDPVFYYNTFSDNSYGVKCYNSDAHFGEPHEVPSGTPNPGYNDIIDNNYGLFATQNSDVFLGMDVATQALGGYNSLDVNSTIDILATSLSDVSAEHNWWGTDGPDTYKDGSSNIYTYNALQEDPDGGSSLAKISSATGEEDKFNPDEVDENDPVELLRLAKYYKNLEHYSESLNILEQIIDNFPDTNYDVKAMLQIYSICRRSDIVNIEEYCLDRINLKDTPPRIMEVSNEILISKYMLERKHTLAEARCNDILTNSPSAESEKHALFNLFLMAIQDLNKTDEAESYKSELEKKYPNDQLTLDAKSLSGEEVDWSLAKENVKEKSDEVQKKTAIPEKYALYQAYPNPFNPITTIKYNLPEAVNVELTVFDINGRVVKKLVDAFIVSGKHSVKWDGRNMFGYKMASGVYVYQLKTGNNLLHKKMLLVK